MAHSFKDNDKFKTLDKFNKDTENARRIQPYRRTKFRLDVLSLDD